MSEYQAYYNEYRNEGYDKYDAFSDTVNKMLGDGFNEEQANDLTEEFEARYEG